MIFATEAGHWYAQDGTPAYEVLGKNGEPRPTTLRDARKLNLVPSVTTIVRCADAPALTNWKQRQVLMAALTLPRIDGEDTETFARRVMADSAEQANVARELGTEIHGAIEKALVETVWIPRPEAHAAIQTLIAWCGADALRPERSFAHPLGYGGKCDVHKKPSLGVNETHAGFVADFKTKDFTADNLPNVYENHAMQLAAYREGFEIPSARGAIIYVSTSEPGLTHLVEIGEDELQRGWEMFKALLRYWQFKNRYYTSTEEGIAA